MKVIDLLNKIANGEEVPKKIKYKGIIREFDYEDKDYTCIGNKDYYLFHDTLAEGTGDKMVTGLNDEVEIIEDTPKDKKKIEKLKSYISCGWNGTCKDLERNELFNDLQKIGTKINEIIDKINGE